MFCDEQAAGYCNNVASSGKLVSCSRFSTLTAPRYDASVPLYVCVGAPAGDQ
jgi:hypothetical protein